MGCRSPEVGHADRSGEARSSRPIIVYYRMPFFKKLSKSQQETFAAHSTAQLLSQFLHGEQGALMTAAASRIRCPTRRQALCRDADHGRGAPRRGVRPLVREDRDRLSDVAVAEGADRRDAEGRPLQKVMIGMNMIVEGLALGAFNNMYKHDRASRSEDA